MHLGTQATATRFPLMNIVFMFIFMAINNPRTGDSSYLLQTTGLEIVDTQFIILRLCMTPGPGGGDIM